MLLSLTGRSPKEVWELRRTMFKSKIHRARVTHADVNYEGSVSIDSNLMDAANIYPFEMVHLWNVTRGARLVTYALPVQAGSGMICVNGAAAHQNKPGDVIIIATFADMEEKEAQVFKPRVVLVDKLNRIVSAEYLETPGPAMKDPRTTAEIPSVLY